MYYVKVPYCGKNGRKLRHTAALLVIVSILVATFPEINTTHSNTAKITSTQTQWLRAT